MSHTYGEAMTRTLDSGELRELSRGLAAVSWLLMAVMDMLGLPSFRKAGRFRGHRILGLRDPVNHEA